MAIRVGLNSIDDSRTIYQLDALGRYLDLLEPSIEKSRQEWEKDIEEQAASIEDSDDMVDFFEWHSDTNWDFEEYHAIFCNYFLVTVYAFMEARLGRLCERVRGRESYTYPGETLKALVVLGKQ